MFPHTNLPTLFLPGTLSSMGRLEPWRIWGCNVIWVVQFPVPRIISWFNFLIHQLTLIILYLHIFISFTSSYIILHLQLNLQFIHKPLLLQNHKTCTLNSWSDTCPFWKIFMNSVFSASSWTSLVFSFRASERSWNFLLKIWKKGGGLGRIGIKEFLNSPLTKKLNWQS